MRRRTLVLPWGVPIGLAACAAPPLPPRAADEDAGDRVWPPPPDPPRFRYEASLRSEADVQGDEDATRLRRLLSGQPRPGERILEKPAAVAARQGRIYVSDAVRRSIVVFDVPRRKLFQFGLRPPGTLAKPTALALDARGRVWVSDAGLRKVLVYDALGLFQKAIGGPDWLLRPTGVAVRADGEEVHVIDRADNDSEAHRVLRFDGDGRWLGTLGQRGSRDGEFNVPVQAAVGPDGQLHVLDAGNFRVQSFDAQGRWLRSLGGVGTGLGRFARPRGLAVDAAGRLYVSDAAFGNVQVFDAQGQLLLALGRGDRRDRPGRYGLLTGVAVDETGRVYLVDQLFGKVEVLRPVPA